MLPPTVVQSNICILLTLIYLLFNCMNVASYPCSLLPAVVIASAQMRVVSTILECGGLSPAARAIGTSLLYHKPLGALLMGGRTGHLQLLSTTTDKVLYNVRLFCYFYTYIVLRFSHALFCLSTARARQIDIIYCTKIN